MSIPLELFFGAFFTIDEIKHYTFDIIENSMGDDSVILTSSVIRLLKVLIDVIKYPSDSVIKLLNELLKLDKDVFYKLLVINQDKFNGDFLIVFPLLQSFVSGGDLSGGDYRPPTPVPEVDTQLVPQSLLDDLKYLTGLGLNKDSQNETMNDRLARYKEITGEDYQ